MKKTLLLILISAIVFQLTAQKNAQWRGENRDGKYQDTGLLQKWPEEGPKLLWHYDDLGDGHASAAVTNDLIYTAGTTEEGNGFVIALDHSGAKIWQTEIGKEWTENWEGTRSTPLVHDGKVYILSSYGKLFCLSAKKGDVIWKDDLFKTYDGVNIKWGVTENLLIDNEKLFVTLGGADANVIALNKDTGKLIWKTKGKGEKSAYNSPLIINHNNKKILVTMTESHILGIDAETGNLLWAHNHPNKYSVHPNTPLFHNGEIYCVSGYGKGGVKIKLSDDGKSVTELWRDPELDNQMGGVILLNDRLYGAGHNNKKWFCLDWKTGKTLYSDKFIKEGNIIFADEHLYCYGQDGKIALVEPKEDSFDVKGVFEVPYGEKHHWAHLVINNKKLYVRHGTSLMVYDIAK